MSLVLTRVPVAGPDTGRGNEAATSSSEFTVLMGPRSTRCARSGQAPGRSRWHKERALIEEENHTRRAGVPRSWKEDRDSALRSRMTQRVQDGAKNRTRRLLRKGGGTGTRPESGVPPLRGLRSG